MTQRVIVWFSCGEASACALKYAIQEYGHDNVIAVYCDVLKTEDEDNPRFMRDVSGWLNHPIQTIRSEKYETIDDVFEKTKYMAGPKGARCTVEMKKIPRLHFQLPDDIHVFGFTSDEEDRIEDFKRRNPELFLSWVLSDYEITKSRCREILKLANINIPRRYLLGFKNNNCECCVKATSISYWLLSRRVNPGTFALRAEQSRRLGVRLCRYEGKRIFLDEIPPDDQILFYGKPLKTIRSTENISCGPECG